MASRSRLYWNEVETDVRCSVREFRNKGHRITSHSKLRFAVAFSIFPYGKSLLRSHIIIFKPSLRSDGFRQTPPFAFNQQAPRRPIYKVPWSVTDRLCLVVNLLLNSTISKGDFFIRAQNKYFHFGRPKVLRQRAHHRTVRGISPESDLWCRCSTVDSFR
jgi:hypothetical protein